MRVFRVVLAVAGGCAVVLAIAVNVVSGHYTDAGWVLVVPLPFYAVGLFAYLHRPGHPAVGWMLAAGAGTVVGVARGRLMPSADQRRRIRWLLAGTAAAFVVWTPTLALPEEGSIALAVGATILWLLGLLFFAGSFLLALFYDGVFGIDQATRRSLVYRVLWSLIALGYVTAAAGLGVLAGRRLPIGVAVLLAIGATLLFQPARRRLERLADQGVSGGRLCAPHPLNRFGTALERTPGPA